MVRIRNHTTIVNDDMGRICKERVVTILRPYTHICLEELRKTMESKYNCCSGIDSNRSPLQYEEQCEG
jgi:hypothetical protein